MGAFPTASRQKHVGHGNRLQFNIEFCYSILSLVQCSGVLYCKDVLAELTYK